MTSTAPCRRVRDQLAGIAAGEALSELVREHLLSCAACQRDFARWRRAHRALAGVAEDMSCRTTATESYFEGLRADIEAGYRRQVASQTQSLGEPGTRQRRRADAARLGRVRSPRRRFWSAIASGVAATGLVAAGLWIGVSARTPADGEWPVSTGQSHLLDGPAVVNPRPSYTNANSFLRAVSHRGPAADPASEGSGVPGTVTWGLRERQRVERAVPYVDELSDVHIEWLLRRQRQR